MFMKILLDTGWMFITGALLRLSCDVTARCMVGSCMNIRASSNISSYLQSHKKAHQVLSFPYQKPSLSPGFGKEISKVCCSIFHYQQGNSITVFKISFRTIRILDMKCLANNVQLP